MKISEVTLDGTEIKLYIFCISGTQNETHQTKSVRRRGSGRISTIIKYTGYKQRRAESKIASRTSEEAKFQRKKAGRTDFVQKIL